MEHTEDLAQIAEVHQALEIILSEHQQLFSHLQFEEIPGIVNAIRKANAIFLLGAGRTGFMIKAAAMRLMFRIGHYSQYCESCRDCSQMRRYDCLLHHQSPISAGTNG
jgi:DNA-binding MurR/RpiR family transcriptional regulator